MVKALIHRVLAVWGGLSKSDLIWIMCQHSHMVETVQYISFNLSIPNTKYCIPDELNLPANEYPPFGLKWKPEITRDGNSWVARLNSQLWFNTSVLAVLCGCQYIYIFSSFVWQIWMDLTMWGLDSPEPYGQTSCVLAPLQLYTVSTMPSTYHVCSNVCVPVQGEGTRPWRSCRRKASRRCCA